MTSSAGLDQDPAAGARNLLQTCAQCREGDRLLIAYEPELHGYFDADVLLSVETEARSLGLHVTLADVGFEPTRGHLPADLISVIAEHDVVLFLSRLGDQLRFSELPDGPRFVVCFASNSHLLGSSFGRADYEALCRVKYAIDDAIAATRRIVVTCSNGTEVTGQLPPADASPRDTSVQRFPMSVFSPVPADLFSGRVALGGFLTGTGSQYYEDYSIEFEGRVWALLDSGRLIGFEGSGADVAKANAHYDRVAAQFDLDRGFVHSWHAGIHPGCGFPWALRENFERWGGAAFGNPRVLHFHTCGAYPPGEISWNVFDPTIELDGVRVWEHGRLYPERFAGGAEILNGYPDLKRLFADPDREIGLGDVA
ncbi:hypothetical protein [Aestuariicoccus sp. MJ-SS9]|uniref:hypothetical protein n=1 Tax=Aestuariicoccus sp. MJ-SS9 TaxID=3079855 RepID=UPI0029063701|nr:hypothetical protein [Aestuariicoccus sp. MJ-SS9]MDU8913542.1 hypothetical protein [Aestuariicoccus sp. MJ-SS9]